MKNSKDTLHIYTRVSTGGQERDGTSLDSQLKMGQQKAKSLGMDFERHNEKSASSSKEDLENRPVIQELLARVAEGEIKHIYVYSLDRLSRNTTTATLIRETLRKGQCTLYTNTNETNLDSHEQNLLFGIISEIAQYENMLRTERLKHGKRVRARQGYWMGGPPPFGYKINKQKKLTVDKEQSVWVERIFEWSGDGDSPVAIKRKLDGNVLTNRDKVIWSVGSVEKILRNPHPRGSYIYFDKEIKCPKIVDDEVVARVDHRLKNLDKRNKSHPTVYDYPLKEIMVCGHCNRMMEGRSTKSKNGQYKSTYKCIRHNSVFQKATEKGDWTRGKYCQNYASMECNPTETVVWESLLNVLRLSYQERELFKKMVLAKKNKSNVQREKDLAKVKSNIETTKITLSDLEESIADKEVEKISSRTKAKSIDLFIGKLQQEHDRQSSLLIELENELVTLQNNHLWVDWYNDYQKDIEDLKSLSKKDQIKMIKKYVEKIEVFFDESKRTHRLDLNLKLPLVGDSLEWKDSCKKSRGYRISKGSDSQVVYLNHNEKN